MNLEVLLSCMYQEDMGIAVRARVQSDLLIINQCNKNGIDEVTDGVHHIRMISSTERGLSKSRNMALENACGDICLICDDDEIFEEGYKDAIIKVFEQMPKADVITFALHHPQRKFPNHCKKLGYIGALKSCSFQIAFRREKVLEKNIRFLNIMTAYF
jgi:glycosyltransferase involved in cell wall biosynthesis